MFSYVIDHHAKKSYRERLKSGVGINIGSEAKGVCRYIGITYTRSSTCVLWQDVHPCIQIHAHLYKEISLSSVY